MIHLMGSLRRPHPECNPAIEASDLNEVISPRPLVSVDRSQRRSNDEGWQLPPSPQRRPSPHRRRTERFPHRPARSRGPGFPPARSSRSLRCQGRCEETRTQRAFNSYGVTTDGQQPVPDTGTSPVPSWLVRDQLHSEPRKLRTKLEPSLGLDDPSRGNRTPPIWSRRGAQGPTTGQCRSAAASRRSGGGGGRRRRVGG